MLKKHKIKLIFIDWNKTLSYSKFWGQLEKDEPIIFNRIQVSLFDKNEHLLDPWMVGKLSSEQICKHLATDLGLPFNHIYKEFVKSCKNMEFSNNEIPNKIELIRNVGIKVYIATDNMDSFDRWTVPAMGLDKLFDGIINSNKIGLLKNEFGINSKSLFIKDVLEKELINPTEAILIDDNQNTLNLFSKHGLTCIKVDEDNSLYEALAKLDTN